MTFIPKYSSPVGCFLALNLRPRYINSPQVVQRMENGAAKRTVCRAAAPERFGALILESFEGSKSGG
jgi:hypothetical protein